MRTIKKVKKALSRLEKCDLIRPLWKTNAILLKILSLFIENYLNRRLGEMLRLKRRGSEAFAKMEKKGPQTQPGFEPRSSVDAIVNLPLEQLRPVVKQR